MTHQERRRFAHALAVVLVEDAALWSVRLAHGDRQAEQWGVLRGTTPIRGYPTVQEAEALLLMWMGERDGLGDAQDQ